MFIVQLEFSQACAWGTIECFPVKSGQPIMCNLILQKYYQENRMYNQHFTQDIL
jgi:hypothetical protein